jgi:phage shock protein A
MRGIEGNFMAQPRVFAHSAVPVDIGSPIAGTEERGCALYVGTGGTLVVEMEGTHQAVDAAGNTFDTNVNIFTNIGTGMFLPILVLKVLESNAEVFAQRVDYYSDLINSLEQENTAFETRKSEVEAALDKLEEKKVELLAQLKEAIEAGNTILAASLDIEVQNVTDEIDELQEELAEIEEQLDQIAEGIDVASKAIKQVEAASEDGTVETEASQILGLF